MSEVGFSTTVAAVVSLVLKCVCSGFLEYCNFR